MNPADLLIAALIVLMASSAVIVLVREKRSGNRCCGCKSCNKKPRVIGITDESDDKE